MIVTLAQHEFTSLLKTGKIWKLLALCQCILGFIFYSLMEDYSFKSQQSLLENNGSFGITEEVIHPLFAWTALFFFFITPLLATHSLTQERKSHTLELYLTSAISSTQIILGKYLGILVGQLFLLLPVLIMPLLITLHDRLDIGQFLSGIFGLILLLSATLSLSFFIACFSKEPLIAALVIFVTLFFLTLLEWIGSNLNPGLQWIKEFALLYHCKNFLSGAINTRDILYYTVFSGTFIYLSVFRLHKESDYRSGK